VILNVKVLVVEGLSAVTTQVPDVDPCDEIVLSEYELVPDNRLKPVGRVRLITTFVASAAPVAALFETRYQCNTLSCSY